ncbi:MAG: hypothetical protein KC416_05265 [Myxococcales bacterium]|nr:hypothetical protein [Myxococcales bacterium]
MRIELQGSLLSFTLLLGGLACSAEGAAGGGDSPFGAAPARVGKADTDYQNPDGTEVEVDVEGDIEAPASRRAGGPAQIAQYAMTYLRERGEFYLESLAEDVSSKDRVEWLVGGEWIPAAESENLDPDDLVHFRIRGVNAVLLTGASVDAKPGNVVTATVPLRPFSVMDEAGDACATPDGHLDLSQSIYWYLWNPERAGCQIETQELQITIARAFPQRETYPEYDRLVEDGKITVVILYGQIGDGPIDEFETGVRNMKRMGQWLLDDGFKEVAAPIGRRFGKRIAGTVVEMDLYSPNDFAGLGDHGNFGNLQRAISEHEIVVYDGHSMLGASDFWSRPEYPDDYQIFIYGGCLGYEYYVRPILEGKGGWENLDLVSSVIEVTASANEIAGPFLAQLMWSLENDYRASWRDLLIAIREGVGDSTFGASGVEENCFGPDGTLCP